MFKISISKYLAVYIITNTKTGIFDFKNCDVKLTNMKHDSVNSVIYDVSVIDANEFIKIFKKICTDFKIDKVKGDFYIYDNSLLGCYVTRVYENRIYRLTLNTNPKYWIKSYIRPAIPQSETPISFEEMYERVKQILHKRYKIVNNIVNNSIKFIELRVSSF